MGSNQELVRGAYQAFAKGDIPSVLSILAPTVHWAEAEGRPYGGTYKATGKSFKAPFAHVWKFENGKAISFQQYTDTAVQLRAMQG